MNLAPIALFVYNRPWHTGKTIEALQKNDLAGFSDLFIFSDAAKNDNAIAQVEEVRQIIKNVAGFKSVSLILREKNFGLANSIVSGVSEVISKFGKIIVVEDDLVTAKNFLNFMNEALEKFQTSEKVFSISGYAHTSMVTREAYFLKMTSSWGWATWVDKWKVFSRDENLLKTILSDVSMHSKFNFDNSYDFLGMAKLQIEKKIDSWAIYWYASVFFKDGLTVFPAQSLVQNIGFDGSGVHCRGNFSEAIQISSYLLPEKICEEIANRELIARILKNKLPSFKERVVSTIKNMLDTLFPGKLNFFFRFCYAKFRLFFIEKKVGAGSFIDKSVNMLGRQNIRIGSNSLIGEWSWLNVNSRDSSSDRIIIGNNCYIGRRNFFSSGQRLIVGDYVMTGNDCKFLGSNHIFRDPMKPYISTGTTSDGILKIGTNAWIGAGVIVIGNVSVGCGSIIGAGSVVNKDIPPFSIAVGNPCRVVKRFDFRINDWVSVSKLNGAEYEKFMPGEEEYLNVLKKNAGQLKMPIFAATSSYGDLP